MITRKKFLHLTGVGVLYSLVPNFILANNFFDPSDTDDVSSLLKTAKKLRENGRYVRAKNKYEDVLDIDPSEIRAYNGIRKILLSKKNQELPVIELYQDALTNVPESKKIKRRLYNQYTKVALGNHKIVDQLDVPNERVLVFVKEKYEELLSQNYHNKKNLEKELEKINKYIDLKVDIEDVRKNKELKKYRKENRQAHKARFDHLSAAETSEKLLELKSREFSNDRLPQIREMSKVNIVAHRKEKNYSMALNASYTYLNKIDNTDPYFIKQFRELSKQLNNYDKLILFEESNHSRKNTFWSAIALFDAYFRLSEKQGLGGSSNMDSLIQKIATKSESPQQHFETATRQIKYLILKQDYTTAKSKLLELCKQKMEISDAHTIDRVNLIIAKFYAKQGDTSNKSQIFEIINNPKAFVSSPDDLVSATALLNLNRSNDNPLRMHQIQQNINNL